MTDQWTEREPLGPSDGGDVGGNMQVDVAWERSWVKPTPDSPGHWSVLTSYYYTARADSTGELYVQHQLEWLICTDQGDPGGTEVWSDYDYTDLADSRESTDELAREFSAADTSEGLGWDGRQEVAR